MPVELGMRFMGDVVSEFLASHPDVTLEADLSGRMVDLVEEGGGKTLYRCKDTECGGDLNGNDHGGGNQGLIEQLYPQARLKDADFSNGWCASGSTPREQHYALATLPDGSGGERTLGIVTFQIGDRTYCDALHDRTAVLVVAVSPKARERKMVTVTSDEMAKALDADGRIALYGILQTMRVPSRLRR